MYALHCVQTLNLPDGRVFLPGHTSYQLTREEAADLMRRHAEHFEPADPVTLRLAEEVLPLGFVASRAAPPPENPFRAAWRKLTGQ